MHRIIPILILLMLYPATVPAGDLAPPAGPADPASAKFTLQDIWDRLDTGAEGAKRTGAFTEPSSNPASSMPDTDQIMGKLPKADNTDGAKPEHVLKDKTVWGLRTDGSVSTWGLQTGTMSNVGAQTITPGTTSQAISPGYHDGTGSVAGDPDLESGNIRSGVTIFAVAGDPNVVDTSSGDAAAGDILSGKKAWVDGEERTGTAAAGTDVTGTDGQKVITIPDGLYSGSKTITAVDSQLIASNIRSGVTIFGVAGNMGCGAYVAPGVWRQFDCYNLAAAGKITNADPFTPSWQLIGGYWQWGRKGPDPIQWYDTNTENFAHGPTGPDSDKANNANIAGWSTDAADSSAWSDASKTTEDPCPDGFRIPTAAQWQGISDNNSQSAVGSTWSSEDTNYTSALLFGSFLMLPAAGGRSDKGDVIRRGEMGCYWSSSPSTAGSSQYMNFLNAGNGLLTGSSLLGLSVRCIAE